MQPQPQTPVVIQSPVVAQPQYPQFVPVYAPAQAMGYPIPVAIAQQPIPQLQQQAEAQELKELSATPENTTPATPASPQAPSPQIPIDHEIPLHFFFGFFLNIIGVLISQLLSRQKKENRNLSASLAGCSLSFFGLFYFLVIYPSCGWWGYYSWPAYVFPACFLVLPFALVLLCVAISLSKTAGTEKGYASEFIFYLFIGLIFGPFATMAFFLKSRRAILGALLGLMTAISGWMCFVWVNFALGPYFFEAWVLFAMTVISWFGLIFCVAAKLRHNDLTVWPARTYIFVNWIFPIYPLIPALVSRNKASLFASVLASLIWMVPFSVMMIIRVSAFFSISLGVCLVLALLFIWVACDHRPKKN